MPYTTRAQIETVIPASILVDALDDDRDGSEDSGVFTAIVEGASTDVDSYLAARYAVPFEADEEADPPVVIPAAVQSAALAFICERIYDRRPGAADKNPWKERADAWRKRLGLIGENKLPLDAAKEAAFTPGAVVTDDMATEESSL